MRAIDFSLEPPQRILLIRLRHIGDVLMMVPTIRAFRSAFPRAYLAALVNAGTEEMLTGNPLLDEILVFDPRWKTLPFRKRVVREMHFLREVRQRGFDWAINLTEGDRGAFLCLASGAKNRVGLCKKGRSSWWKERIFTRQVVVSNSRAHMVEQILEVPRALALQARDKRIEVFCAPEDQQVIGRLLEEEGVKPGELLIHVHPTSRWLFKCWRDEGMAQVIDGLQQNGRARVVLTGGREEKELAKIESILKLARTRPVNLAGRTTLKQLAALSRRCQFFIGVDTAPMHIAAAVGTPVIALFGPSGEFNWGPWGQGHVVIKKDMDCRPCGRDGCQGSKRSRCLEEISAEEVLLAAFQFLSRAEQQVEKGTG